MKKILFTFLFASFCYMGFGIEPEYNTLAEGEQPQISMDPKGVVRVAFGMENKIYCSTSTDNGISFSNPVLVAEVPKMHLGMTRGPQIASSANYSVISAMDESGNIHCFKLKHSANKWNKIDLINDIKGSAPEGLMSIAADNKDNFYAVWLDIRIEKKNNIYFSSLKGKEEKWSENRLVYQSPEGNVCECCKPSIAVKGPKVAIMFRNWFGGSRDLYLAISDNMGNNFLKAEKLGIDTWKLNGCPMDGGGVAIDNSNIVHTAWRREGSVYYCKAGETEIKIEDGRSVSIAMANDKPLITFQNKEGVKLISLKKSQNVIIGKGNFLKSISLPDNKILCVWEQDNKIRFKKI